MSTVFLKSTVRPWESVKPPVVQDLKENIEDVVMRLLDLIEQDDGERTPAHGLGQLSALFIAHIAWRGANQAGDRVLLHIFRHVDPDHVGFVVKEGSGKRSRQFRFSDARGAEKQK